MTSMKRRQLLKAISAATAAAAVPLGVSSAANTGFHQHVSLYIDIRHDRYKGSATRQIINRGKKPLLLNGYQPVTITGENGNYISINLNTPCAMYTLQPGECLPVYAQAVMTSLPTSAQLMAGDRTNAAIALI